MSDNETAAVVASEPVPAEAGTPVPNASCESPPPAPMPARENELDPRVRLLQLAAELARSRNRRMLAEFLRLRRMV